MLGRRRFGCANDVGGFGACLAVGGLGAANAIGGFGACLAVGGFGAANDVGVFGACLAVGGLGAVNDVGGLGAAVAVGVSFDVGGFGAVIAVGGFGVALTLGADKNGEIVEDGTDDVNENGFGAGASCLEASSVEPKLNAPVLNAVSAFVLGVPKLKPVLAGAGAAKLENIPLPGVLAEETPNEKPPGPIPESDGGVPESAVVADIPSRIVSHDTHTLADSAF